MNLFTHIANLITFVVRPEKAAFTTVIYPSQGKAVVMHDGLGIRQERRWYQVDSLENGDTSTSFDSSLQDHTNWADSFDPVDQIQAEDIFSISSPTNFEPMETSWINPANGMPMLDSCFDVMGNAFGTNTMIDSLSLDHSMSSFGDSFSSFGFD